MITTRYNEKHDSLSLVLIFAPKTSFEIRLTRTRLSLAATTNVLYPKTLMKFLTDYLMDFDPEEGLDTGERFKAIATFANTCKTPDDFFRRLSSIVDVKDQAALLRSKAASMKAAKTIEDLKVAKASGKKGAVMKVLQDAVAKPKTTVTGSKYEYPEGLNDAQKKAFRAKARKNAN